MTQTTQETNKTSSPAGKPAGTGSSESVFLRVQPPTATPITRSQLPVAFFDLDSMKTRALELAAAGEVEQAIFLYGRIVASASDDGASHFQLAQLLSQADRLADAARSYAKVLSLHPEIAEVHLCLGRTLHELGDPAAARQCFERAVTLDPSSAEALSNLASIYMDVGELQPSEVLLRHAVQLQPDFVAAHCNLGRLLEKRGDTVGATQSFRNALTLDPTHVPTLCNLGFMLDNLGDAPAAVNCYRLALASQPDEPLGLFNLSTHLLAEGDFTAGWRAYEARWLTQQFSASRRPFQQPPWRGEDIAGLRLFLYAEQGLGDTLQFARYARMLADLGAEVILEVQPAVFDTLGTLDGAAQVIEQGMPLPEFDLHSPLMSVPSILHPDCGNPPAGAPYVSANHETANQWSRRMQGNKPRVGLVWSGNPKHSRDRLRSISLSRFEDLLHLSDITFYSLQKGPAAAELAELSQDRRPIDLEHDLRDFTDTAAVIANLNLVITVDTAVAHLAGAMGKPVWILLPRTADWRWLKERTDSPWYPTARLFRQGESGCWDQVLEQVHQELALTFARHGNTPMSGKPCLSPEEIFS
ncbi:tetratricopeptide repeat protein [Granulicella sibirica]|uniref:Uncharacterized protein n=1 Tax=Granulicella sibirica TaxID=2479048 RepID=A0A4Q0T206_9BACT|nr:tetratricopeptide repeat-containing glycosyltransferase family protein [Granulicella sibirica]RXH57217.1 hypothetical protein GRAN_0527 [Granulicella sibirica]